MKKDTKMTPDSVLEFGVKTKKESLDSLECPGYYADAFKSSKLNLSCDLPYSIPEHGRENERHNTNYIDFNAEIPVDVTRAVRNMAYECRDEFTEKLHEVQYSYDYDSDGDTGKSLTTKYYVMLPIFTLKEVGEGVDNVFFPYYSKKMQKKIEKNTKLLVREKDAIHFLNHALNEVQQQWWRWITLDTESILCQNNNSDFFKRTTYKNHKGLACILKRLIADAKETQYNLTQEMYCQKYGSRSLDNFIEYKLADYKTAEQTANLCDDVLDHLSFIKENHTRRDYELVQGHVEGDSIHSKLNRVLQGMHSLNRLIIRKVGNAFDGDIKHCSPGYNRELELEVLDNIKPLIMTLSVIITGKEMVGHEFKWRSSKAFEGMSDNMIARLRGREES